MNAAPFYFNLDMKHYIDAEKLIAEIERKRDSALERQKNLEKIGQETVLNEMIAFELNRLISFVVSLQQEQSEVDLEKEIYKEWGKCYPTDEGMGDEKAILVSEQFHQIACHFYKLGLNAKKEE